MAFDVYQTVTDRIVAELEAGTMPWLKPWKAGKASSGLVPHNAVTGREYNGINWLLLASEPWESTGWLTYKQAQELGGNVIKGQKGTMIVYFARTESKERDEITGLKKVYFLCRAYTVFNVEQCEGLEEKRIKTYQPIVAPEFPMNEIAKTNGAKISHGGNRAFFDPSRDFIGMPEAESFKTPNDYQSTLAHELCHWTGHKDRLSRDFSGRFGNSSYAFEELIAEIGSAFVCAQSGITLEDLQHSNYVASWLETLKNDKRAVFKAASEARKASEWLLGSREEKISEAA